MPPTRHAVERRRISPWSVAPVRADLTEPVTFTFHRAGLPPGARHASRLIPSKRMTASLGAGAGAAGGLPTGSTTGGLGRLISCCNQRPWSAMMPDTPASSIATSPAIAVTDCTRARRFCGHGYHSSRVPGIRLPGSSNQPGALRRSIRPHYSAEWLIAAQVAGDQVFPELSQSFLISNIAVNFTTIFSCRLSVKRPQHDRMCSGRVTTVLCAPLEFRSRHLHGGRSIGNLP